jgi:hypothetical protein
LVLVFLLQVWYNIGKELVMTNTVNDFWRLVDKKGPDDCWNWLRYPSMYGYGTFYFEGVRKRVHVLAYEFTKGKLGPGISLHHTCENKICCNPDHQEPLSNSEHALATWESRRLKGVDPHIHFTRDTGTGLLKCGRGHIQSEESHLCKICSNEAQNRRRHPNSK